MKSYILFCTRTTAGYRDYHEVAPGLFIRAVPYHGDLHQAAAGASKYQRRHESLVNTLTAFPGATAVRQSEEDRVPPQIGDTVYGRADTGSPWAAEGTVVGEHDGVCYCIRNPEFDCKVRKFCEENKVPYDPIASFIWRFGPPEKREWNTLHKWGPENPGEPKVLIPGSRKPETGELDFRCQMSRGTPIELARQSLRDPNGLTKGARIIVSTLFGKVGVEVTEVDYQARTAMARDGSNVHFLQFDPERGWVCTCSGNLAALERAKFV